MNVFAEALSAVAAKVRNSTVKVGRTGSGVIWRRDGTLVTNAHVVTQRRTSVELADGRVLPAIVERTDRERDLALLRVDAGDLPEAEIVPASQLRIGDVVVAIGNPLGFTSGIVHATGGVWIQADITLAPGNSGGPLADARGRVAGINSMMAGSLGIAVPSETVERFLAGEPEQPRIGITLEGSVVVDVESGGIAAQAGLRQGDVVVGGPRRLLVTLRNSRRGEPVYVELIRGGREVTIGVLARP